MIDKQQEQDESGSNRSECSSSINKRDESIDSDRGSKQSEFQHKISDYRSEIAGEPNPRLKIFIEKASKALQWLQGRGIQQGNPENIIYQSYQPKKKLIVKHSRGDNSTARKSSVPQKDKTTFVPCKRKRFLHLQIQV